jgi:hypothetical protein
MNSYSIGFVITGGIVFIVAYIYAICTYGFFLGAGLGWIPAVFIALLAGALWPLILFGILLAAVILIYHIK